MKTDSLAPSDSSFGRACAGFSASFAVFYGLFDVYRMPLLTFYPATGLWGWGWLPDTDENGPAMYWYGWILSSLIGALLVASVASWWPRRLRHSGLLHLSWVVPLIMVPVMAYTLKVYWR